MACGFGSPDLVTSLSSIAASPTFAFDATNSNYFGLAGSFTSNNGAVCSFPTRYVAQQGTSTYGITPIIVTAGRTTTCSILAPPSITPSASGSTTYSGFECPSIIDNRLTPGTYTLKFDQPNVAGVSAISSRTFIVASPTISTDRTTTTIMAFVTAPSLSDVITTYLSTSTVALPVPTDAGGAVTQTVTAVTTATTTLTDFVSLCAAVAQTSSDVGNSTSSSATSIPTATLPVSENGQCGTASGQTCIGSTFGSCCSLYGFCGGTDIYCLTTEGCQPGYGDCIVPSFVSSSISPSPTSNVSLDGSCGGERGFVCPGSGLGDCCSPYGWCGSSDSHCGAGCQNAFGVCSGPTPTGTGPLPTSTLRVSLNGACGGTTGQTCSGSNFGSCCSEYGYCGSEELYCTGACQPEFGTCSTSPAKRLPPKANLEASRFAAFKRERDQVQEKRAIGGAGPDYTYPPIPRTTITSTATQTTTLFPTATAGRFSTIVSTVTITIITPLPVTRTTTVLIPITTETVRATQTICPTAG